MALAEQSPVTIRRAQERFHTQIGWLNSWHSFSFGEHHDPAHMGYRSLRVINDDTVAPGQGFGRHSHAGMEIFTYVISGELKHQDSMGNGRVIGAGEFQYMSAGEGVEHSEFNASDSAPVHFLQIWIEPAQQGGKPCYADVDTKRLQKEDSLVLLASPSDDEASFTIRQNAEIYFGNLSQESSLILETTFDHQYLHLIAGELEIRGELIFPQDGIALKKNEKIRGNKDSKFILFSLR